MNEFYVKDLKTGLAANIEHLFSENWDTFKHITPLPAGFLLDQDGGLYVSNGTYIIKCPENRFQIHFGEGNITVSLKEFERISGQRNEDNDNG